MVNVMLKIRYTIGASRWFSSVDSSQPRSRQQPDSRRYSCTMRYSSLPVPVQPTAVLYRYRYEFS